MKTGIFSKMALMAILALAITLCLAPTALAADQAVVITDSQTVAVIQGNIQAAIDAAGGSGNVTVSGSKTGAGTTLALDIPIGVKVVWKADYAGSAGTLIDLDNAGTFEIAAGVVTATGDGARAIHSGSGKVTVSGGSVFATGKEGLAINTDSGEVAVSGGTVSSTLGDAISTDSGDVTVSGTATVQALGATYKMTEELYWVPCAIITVSATVTVSGGKVEATGKGGIAISTGSGEVKVNGGTVSTSGDLLVEEIGYNYIFISAIAIRTNSGKVTVSGGTVNSTLGDAITTGSGDVTVFGNATVRTSGDALVINQTYEYIHCAVMTGSGKVTVSGGSVSTSGEAGFAIFTDSGYVTVNGGMVSTTGKNGFSSAICSIQGEVLINGGTVTASEYFCMAIQTGMGKVVVSNGTVNAAGDMGRAIESYYSDVAVSGGTVSAKGKGGIAIVTDGDVTISGGTVSATGGVDVLDYNGAKYYRNSYAILTGGEVTASGGTVENSGDAGIAIWAVGNVTVSANAIVRANGGVYFFDDYNYYLSVAILAYEGNVAISGNAFVQANGWGGRAIAAEIGNVSVNGGTVEATGVYGIAIFTLGENSITSIRGGMVRGDSAIEVINGGVAAFLAGTCSGDFYVYGNQGLIVQVASLGAGAPGSANGLVTKAGAVSAKWAAGGNIQFTLSAGLAPKTLWWSNDINNIFYGDVNGDGVINMQDVLLIYQHFRGKITLTANQLLAADVNKDNIITMQDVLLVYQYFRGKIVDFLP